MRAAAMEFPRSRVAPGESFDRWSSAEPYYRELAQRQLTSLAEFESWLHDWSEVDSIFDEEGTSRQIDMTCATDDSAREARFLDFLENVRPHREPWHNKLREKLVEAVDRLRPPPRYEVLARSARNACAIFREENIPLQVEDARLGQQYQKISGAMTVTYRGQELTLQQAARFLEESDRKVREESWRLTSQRYLQDAAEFDRIYAEMVAVRDRMGRNAGCRDYREFAFKAMERFDYTPADCLAFHEAIERVVVPAAAGIAAERKKKLGVATLRPWDSAVDPDGREPLRPFQTDEQLSDGCARVFQRVDGELAAVFATMRERGMLDLGSRKGKAPGGYQATYDERRMPFIFMNAVGTESDVRTLLHEGGHAFHTWACRTDPVLAYRHYPTEFAEVASMGMECLSLPFLDEFYGPDTNRARKRFLIEIVNFLPYMCRVDALQHHVYTSAAGGGDGAALLEGWKDEWQRLTRRFSPATDWSGLERDDRHSWHRKLHFFEAPFYYVEYGIAQLGALQVWVNAGRPISTAIDERRYADAVKAYRRGLALGGSRPLPELFSAAGLKLDFSEATLRPLIEAVMDAIAKL
jgi:oligoendopeptidase F